jgi:general secretion pathway protein E
VLQIPVNEKKGLTFARGLRSILRHDPDKIMVGEIRDRDTAEIAVQSALTGHMVLSTVHANNVFDVIGRFANMGVDSYSLVAALNGIVAQRLLRMNCPHCAAPCSTPSEVIARSGLSQERIAAATFKRGLGCAHCRGTGYKGRRAIAETLPMSDTLRDQLVNRAALSQIRQSARDSGFTSLRDAAVALALSGQTTVEEINRVTPVE